MNTHYEVLGVARTDPEDVIRAAYLTLARQHHPDRAGGDTATMTEVTNAYGVLKNAKRREAYDESLRLLNDECSTCHGDGRTYRSKGWHGKVSSLCEQCNGVGYVSRPKRRR